MLKLFRKSKIVLREQKTKGDSRYLSAEIKKNGDLVFMGQDLGVGVEDALGCSEYEWCWTVKAEHINTLKSAIGKDGYILDLLYKTFSDEKAAELQSFMINNKIPFESWSRIGD